MKPKKLTTYQRLKEENYQMYQELSILVQKPKSLEAEQIKFKYKMKFDLEDAMWSGSTNHAKRLIDTVFTIKKKGSENKKENLVSTIKGIWPHIKSAKSRKNGK